MKQQSIKINKGQYLTDVLDEIESNKIYFKVLPGIGATTKEIKTIRWSIIIEPNVPVIKGKKGKDVFGVYEGVNVDDIVNYIKNSKIKHKKIMVTPESFAKVKDACEILEINIYETFFLLFDECDRTMKDVAFRKKILLPMDDFFIFKQKAFISATAVIPSDPRFEEQGFELVYIEPTFEYRTAIDVIICNNVSIALKTILLEHPEERICIFLNSIKAITGLIADMNIKTNAHIYCSREKMYPLKASGYHCYESINDNKFAKINLFTSRFNSAVDMLMEDKPIVILATNLHFAHHTMIDPTSEAAQIVGRFRNGIEKAYAITNSSEDLLARTPEEAVSYLEGCEESYNVITTLRNSATNEGAKNTLEEALKRITYSDFVNEDGSKNSYMFDNFLYDESVKMIFKTPQALSNAYQNCYFKPTIEYRDYQISDSDYKIEKNGISIASLVLAVVNAIKKLEYNSDQQGYIIDNRNAVLNDIQKCYTEIYNAYFILGEYELLKNSYSSKQIKSAVKAKLVSEQKSNFMFLEDILEVFPDGYEASSETIKTILKNLINKHQLTLKPEIKLLGEYFHHSPRRSLKSKPNEKGYKIISSKFNRIGQ
jgi:hypothetical protein